MLNMRRFITAYILNELLNGCSRVDVCEVVELRGEASGAASTTLLVSFLFRKGLSKVHTKYVRLGRFWKGGGAAWRGERGGVARTR